jgi:hypothetical protein
MNDPDPLLLHFGSSCDGSEIRANGNEEVCNKKNTGRERLTAGTLLKGTFFNFCFDRKLFARHRTPQLLVCCGGKRVKTPIK